MKKSPSYKSYSLTLIKKNKNTMSIIIQTYPNQTETSHNPYSRSPNKWRKNFHFDLSTQTARGEYPLLAPQQTKHSELALLN